MITHEEALKLFSTFSPIGEQETISLEESLGRILAQDMKSPCDLPLFNNSAMDGIAIRHSQMGSDITLDGTRLAKAVKDKLDDPKTSAIRIMTGAKVPPWADVVIPVEFIEDRKNISFKKGDNIRYAGEDFKKGELIYRKDNVLTPDALMVLASFGIQKVPVFKLPTFWLATTGDEVKELGSPLKEGEIYNTSSLYLKSNLKTLGYSWKKSIHLHDHKSMIYDFLKRWLKVTSPSFLVTTGAVSMGEKDDLPILARELGFKIHFHKVAIRPGKPILFASRENHFWIGAPGNAISTAVAWTYFIRPFLFHWARISLPLVVEAPLAHDVQKPHQLKAFFRGNFDGKVVSIPKDQGSQRVKATAFGNVFAELSLDQTFIPKGTVVKCTMFSN